MNARLDRVFRQVLIERNRKDNFTILVAARWSRCSGCNNDQRVLLGRKLMSAHDRIIRRGLRTPFARVLVQFHPKDTRMTKCWRRFPNRMVQKLAGVSLWPPVPEANPNGPTCPINTLVAGS